MKRADRKRGKEATDTPVPSTGPGATSQVKMADRNTSQLGERTLEREKNGRVFVLFPSILSGQEGLAAESEEVMAVILSLNIQLPFLLTELSPILLSDSHLFQLIFKRLILCAAVFMALLPWFSGF